MSKRGAPTMRILNRPAGIFDLDGVVTRTAAVHARAWKTTFDRFLQDRQPRPDEDLHPFSIESDYFAYVDGKPRYDGVRDFLQSRGISLPEGTPDDSPETLTVCGLGNRKNQLFQTYLQRDGAEVFPDAVDLIDRLRESGCRVAVVSSSRNCRAILESAGLISRFDVILDGGEAKALNLRGKPEPDTFLEATRRLQVAPNEAFVVEDAIVGIQAGRAGGFGLVIGIAHDQPESALQTLRDAGAHRVVTDLRELLTED